MTKKLFISRLMRDRDKFEQLVNRVGYARRMTLKGVIGKWSVKDILAHILAYEQYMADRLEEIVQGNSYVPCRTQTALEAFLDEYGYPDFGSPLLDEETPDAWVIEKYHNVSLEDVVMQEINAFASIISSLEKLSEEKINEHNLYERVTHHTSKHYREHIRDIKRWLAVNASNSKNS